MALKYATAIFLANGYYRYMPSLKQLHGDFLEDIEIAQGRSPRTAQNYDAYLKRFYEKEKITDVGQITNDKIRSFRRYLSTKGADGLSLATQNYHFIALRQFLKYVAKRGIRSLGPEHIGLAKVGEREIDVLYPEEVDQLLQAPEGNAKDTARDRAILEVLYSTGMRLSELISLDRDDIRAKSSELPIRGKGNKVRVVFLSDSAKEAIKDYVEQREDVDPALFIRHNPASAKATAGAEKGDDLRISPRSVQRLIKKHAASAGLTKHITPHTLRHSFATDLLSNGADVRQVQQLLGHASITTTQIYTHLTDVHLKEVHDEFHRKS